MSQVAIICQSMARSGYGWEDVMSVLRKRDLASDAEAQFVRRFVLGLSSYSRRYGT